MLDLFVTVRLIEEHCFEFCFRGESFSTSMYINNPYSKTKTEWMNLRDAIKNDTHYALMINNEDEHSYIESCGYKGGNILSFVRKPSSSRVSLKVEIDLDTDRIAILAAFDELLNNPECDEYWNEHDERPLAGYESLVRNSEGVLNTGVSSLCDDSIGFNVLTALDNTK